MVGDNEFNLGAVEDRLREDDEKRVYKAEKHEHYRPLIMNYSHLSSLRVAERQRKTTASAADGRENKWVIRRRIKKTIECQFFSKVTAL